MNEKDIEIYKKVDELSSQSKSDLWNKMDRKEMHMYKKQLEFYEKFAEADADLYHRLKEKNPYHKRVIQQKLIISGLHIELREYEKPLYIGTLRSRDSIEAGVEKRKESQKIKDDFESELNDFLERHPDVSKVFNPEPLDELEKIKEKYSELLPTREDNQKRKIASLRHKIQANFSIWTHFITLSFAENLMDVKLAKSRLKEWTKKMKEIVPTFQYVYVMEFQERGSIHFHVLCSLHPGGKLRKADFNKVRHSWNWGTNTNGIDISGINYKYVEKEFRDQAKDELKQLNVSEQVKTIWSIGNYLTSYLKKQATGVLLWGNKMYGCSSGLKDEIVITDKEKIAHIQRQLGLERLKENVYTVKIDETENTVIKKFYNMLIKNT